ncbi:hypothetical protein CEE45_12810 [Candidatus Heimdallarchaeota archaeon B3_Heim]|nr:MAG: hypothetical protein CEE45_12810 [Candidatus Heimdallarchaeota archaeon B3_Heim]
MLTENQLVNQLELFLRNQLQFQTYSELQIGSNDHFQISEFLEGGQKQIRIDLAGICQLDSSIHFFEAETQIHINHPSIYSQFCDYCYLLCPDEQFELLNNDTLEEQLLWAREIGIGIISISNEGKIRNRVPSIQQNLNSEVRKEILNSMNQRYKIPFSTTPLWNRPRQLIS